MNWGKGISRVYIIFSVVICVAALASARLEVILSAIGGCVFWYYAIRWVIRGFSADSSSQKAPEDSNETESSD